MYNFASFKSIYNATMLEILPYHGYTQTREGYFTITPYNT